MNNTIIPASINLVPLLSLEPIGMPDDPPIGSSERGQHFIATVLVGPQKGEQIRFPPSAYTIDYVPLPSQIEATAALRQRMANEAIAGLDEVTAQKVVNAALVRRRALAGEPLAPTDA